MTIKNVRNFLPGQEIFVKLEILYAATLCFMLFELGIKLMEERQSIYLTKFQDVNRRTFLIVSFTLTMFLWVNAEFCRLAPFGHLQFVLAHLNEKKIITRFLRNRNSNQISLGVIQFRKGLRPFPNTPGSEFPPKLIRSVIQLVNTKYIYYLKNADNFLKVFDGFGRVVALTKMFITFSCNWGPFSTIPAWILLLNTWIVSAILARTLSFTCPQAKRSEMLNDRIDLPG